jgi:Tol biopolymer transport system component
VLDFGLAKSFESLYVDPEAPTIAPDESSLTHQRAILGTVGWMSPEQASGETVDARSDVFAFGVLMYEMLTGKHPFRRKSTLETLAAIREEEPERPTEVVPSLPPEAERAVLRCLRKDPSKRWQSLSDLGAVLEDLKEDTESGRGILVEHAAVRRRGTLGLVVALAAIVVVAAVATVLILLPGRGSIGPPELRRLTYDAGPTLLPSISPDGNLIAFTSDRNGNSGYDVWVRHINQPEPTRLTDHPADDWFPRFSPDGARIVFRSQRDQGGIYIVNALGGGLRKVAGPGYFPRFSPDGASIVYVEDPQWAPSFLRKMFRVPVQGGEPQPFIPGWGTYPPPTNTGPIFSPDGRRVLFRGAPFDDPRRSNWWVAPVDGGEPWSSDVDPVEMMLDVVSCPSIWLPGRLLFVAGTTISGINLYRASITDDGRISGPVEPLTTGPGMTWAPTVSSNGLVALERSSWIIHLWEIALDPANGRPVGAPSRITDDASPKFSFSLTRDGSRLAYSTYAGYRGKRRTEIHLQDRSSGEKTVPVSLATAAVSLHTRLSGDGSLLAWSAPIDGQTVSLVAPTDNPVGRELCRECTVVDFFTDGEHVLVDRGPSLSRVRIADGAETPILEMGESRRLLDTDLSRDDRWLAVQIGEPDGSAPIYAVPLDEDPVAPKEWVRIPADGYWAGAPRWSTDGNTLYYLSDRDDFICVWGQHLHPDSRMPVGEPFPVAHAHASAMHRMPFGRGNWTLEVGGNRLVFNAEEMEGDVYTAMLAEE